MTVDDEYTQTFRCSYEGREYLVRDNGAICRVPRSNARPAKYDGVWTFGVKRDSKAVIYTLNIKQLQIQDTPQV